MTILPTKIHFSWNLVSKSRNSKKFNFDEEYVVITAEPDTIIPELRKV